MTVRLTQSSSTHPAMSQWAYKASQIVIRANGASVIQPYRLFTAPAAPDSGTGAHTGGGPSENLSVQLRNIQVYWSVLLSAIIADPSSLRADPSQLWDPGRITSLYSSLASIGVQLQSHGAVVWQA